MTTSQIDLHSTISTLAMGKGPWDLLKIRNSEFLNSIWEQRPLGMSMSALGSQSGAPIRARSGFDPRPPSFPGCKEPFGSSGRRLLPTRRSHSPSLENSASKIGESTGCNACWILGSVSVEMPSVLTPPCGLSIPAVRNPSRLLDRHPQLLNELQD